MSKPLVEFLKKQNKELTNAFEKNPEAFFGFMKNYYNFVEKRARELNCTYEQVEAEGYLTGDGKYLGFKVRKNVGQRSL